MPEHQEITKPKILIVEDETIIAFDPKISWQQTGIHGLGPRVFREKGPGAD